MKLSRLCMLGFALTSLAFFSCSGEDGKPGEPGPKGDSIQGETGPQGEPGEDKPNVDFYFQNGFKGYSGTQDATIDNIGGTDNGDNGITTAISFAEGSVDTEYSLFRFDNISQEISSALIENNQDCSSAFHLNQAILYVYVSDFYNDSESLYIKVGFYNDEDPLFVEEEVTWGNASIPDAWDAKGGESNSWTGLFPGTDNYSIQYNVGTQGFSTSVSGWLPILLPRSVVEEWICNDVSNKGIRLRLDGDNADTGGSITILSSENTAEDLRPLLVIETEKIELSVTTKAAVSSKQLDWDSMTYEEKMAPFYRFLESK
ncbi:hypothetical protein M3P19_11525 [Muricauda sp. 2012CJ35-5]|uniref:Collagen-like protein n=1 Tax=Flagellimonas spongiicola TaxID=2942208 RepID=A0ABT0PVA6_9FLAO|nr:hypothetical protein [Allomuricauda spongiicola]MCL6274642.1 hypothetical protein [Allomuricauda spongiicola]